MPEKLFEPSADILPQSSAWFFKNLGLPGTQQVVIPVPWLKHVGPYFVPRVRCHKKVAPQLEEALRTLHLRGLHGWVIAYLGCYAFRKMRGGVALSRHAWGAAVDFNAEWNQLGQRPADWGQRGTLKPIVGTMQAFGFAWGGHWRRPDGMHFEVCRLLTPLELAEREQQVKDYLRGA